MTEWLKVIDCKSVNLLIYIGSNPIFSRKQDYYKMCKMKLLYKWNNDMPNKNCSVILI
jgi:hypothetical protein